MAVAKALEQSDKSKKHTANVFIYIFISFSFGLERCVQNQSL